MATILIAEDDDNMRFFIHNALVRAGHFVKSVENAKKALALLEKEEFDLLLTDVSMPGMNGLELTQEGLKKWPSMRVIFITGFSAMALKCRKYNSKISLLSKPFHLNDLIHQIDVTLIS